MDKQKTAQLFVQAGLIDKDELRILVEANAKNPDEKMEDTLVRLRFATEQDAVKAVAQGLNIPFVDLSSGVDPKTVELIPLNLASQHGVFPVRVEDGALILAMKDPRNTEALDMARFACGLHVAPHIAPAGAIEQAISQHYHVEENIADYMRNVPDAKKGVEFLTENRMSDQDLKDLKKKSESAPVIQLVNSLLVQGLSKGASDIHIEPQEKLVMVRNRVDGILQEAVQVPKWVQAALASRLKIMAGMDIAEKRVPQDGRIKIKAEGKTVDLRISTLPTQHGEKIVVRILDSGKDALTIGELGFRPELVGPLKETINQPQGMLIVCGPTGSGKTTTLYGLLSEIAKKKINIITLEDPIEYALQGVNQVQINDKAGLTFAKSLRSVLRQDPNVIFVGEIRDGETAEIAMRSSLTGHLVLSTLHTNDSIATITRLLDLKIEPYLLASSLSCVLAQRLVRTICDGCREEHEPNPDVVKKVESVLGEEISFLFYHGKGCDKCQGTGYKGRLSVHELLLVTPEIREIIRQQGASEAKIKAAARKNGFKTLLEDTLEKVRQGLTTVEEAERVLVFEEDESNAAPARPCEGCAKPLEAVWKTCPHCGRTVAGSPSPATAPQAAAAAPPANAAPARTPGDFSGYKILLADDDEDLVRNLSHLLIKNKFSVSAAANGREALELLTKDKPHILITDVLMPEMDGYELVRRVRQDVATTFTPVIILSQRHEVQDRLKGFEMGSDDYLAKPFSPEEMLFRIKAILKRVWH